MYYSHAYSLGEKKRKKEGRKERRKEKKEKDHSTANKSRGKIR